MNFLILSLLCHACALSDNNALYEYLYKNYREASERLLVCYSSQTVGIGGNQLSKTQDIQRARIACSQWEAALAKELKENKGNGIAKIEDSKIEFYIKYILDMAIP